MITRLYISNYALIEQLEVDFKSGLTIITGETGAGKSIILGALSLILGGRADTSTIHNPNAKTIVEADFDISDNTEIRQYLYENEVDMAFGDNVIIVRREISSTGRSRVFINDGVISVGALRSIMSHLVDIHSQHSNMLLSQPAFQLSIIDSIIPEKEIFNDYSVQYAKYKQAEAELEDFTEQYSKSMADLEYITFQYKQLDGLLLRENEDEELEAQQKILSNAGEIREGLWLIENLLNGEERSIISDLNTISSTISRNVENLSELSELNERVESVQIELKDICQTINSLGGTISDDPRKLQEIEERQNDIFTALRKFNVSSVNELIALREQFKQRIDDIQNFDDRHDELEKILSEEREKAVSLATEMSKRRKAAAKLFQEQLEPLARTLGMKNLLFKVEFNQTDLRQSGVDDLQFKFAFNKNQSLMPVKDSASGGEISRLMLCIKTIVAHSINLPTIIFDEVDTGVSGEIAARMGEMMQDISRRIQVIAITHLPQVAALGDNHLLVYKHDTDKQTTTSIEELSSGEHINEIARMLSAGKVDEASLANARSLIHTFKQNIKHG